MAATLLVDALLIVAGATTVGSLVAGALELRAIRRLRQEQEARWCDRLPRE